MDWRPHTPIQCQPAPALASYAGELDMVLGGDDAHSCPIDATTSSCSQILINVGGGCIVIVTVSPEADVRSLVIDDVAR